MLFQNEEASLTLEVWNYEFPEASGADGAWLVLRALYQEVDGVTIRDSNSCLRTEELQEMTAGLKVLSAGIRDHYESNFQEPYFLLNAAAEGEGFRVQVSFVLVNTMEDLDAAEIEVQLTKEELSQIIDELDGWCRKFPVRI